MNLGTKNLQVSQAESRCKVASTADVIVPGHGPAFHVTNEIREKLFQQFEEIKLKKSDYSA